MSARANRQDREQAGGVTRSPRFLLALVHELRGPLSSLSMAAELLEQNRTGQLDSQVLRSVGAIRESASDLGDLLGQVARLARLEAGSTEVEWKPIALEGLLSELFEELAPLARSQEAVVRTILEPGTPATWVSDPALLRELLRTVLGAALTASAGGEVVLNVAPEPFDGPPPGDHGPPVLCFRVTDSGPALGDVDAAELLAPFGKHDPRTRRRYGGRGLGLVVARATAELLGGALEATGSDQGACMVVRLPQRATGS